MHYASFLPLIAGVIAVIIDPMRLAYYLPVAILFTVIIEHIAARGSADALEDYEGLESPLDLCIWYDHRWCYRYNARSLERALGSDYTIVSRFSPGYHSIHSQLAALSAPINSPLETFK